MSFGATLTLDGCSPPCDTLTVKAANPGVWGCNVQVSVEYPTNSPSSDTFNMSVREMSEDQTRVVNSEVYYNLSMDKDSSTYVVDVINNQSSLIQLTDIGGGEIPYQIEFTNLGQELGECDGRDGQVPDADALTDGMNTLDTIAPYVFNILCLPAAANLDDDGKSVYSAAITYCESKRAFLIVDIPADVASLDNMNAWMTAVGDAIRHKNAAVYFPRLEIADQLKESRPRNVGASGTLAGIYARTDATRGVWKAPAGTEATLRGASPVLKLTDLENGGLNPLGINVLRILPVYGNVCW